MTKIVEFFNESTLIFPSGKTALVLGVNVMVESIAEEEDIDCPQLHMSCRPAFGTLVQFCTAITFA